MTPIALKKKKKKRESRDCRKGESKYVDRVFMTGKKRQCEGSKRRNFFGGMGLSKKSFCSRGGSGPSSRSLEKELKNILVRD